MTEEIRPKKLFIKTYGCQMNVYDSDRMADALAPHGYEPTQTMDDADLVLLNTCHIREKASEKVFSELGRLAELRAEGRPVFVNYTAAWCVSCQVNDRVALSTKGVAAAMKAHNVAYLKADWTKKDADIAAELARYGRAGVPLYLVYGADGADGVILPSILTEGIVVKALNKAAAKG